MTVCSVEDRHKDKENRIENPNRKNTQIGQLIFYSGAKAIQCRKRIFQHMVLEQSNNHK